MNICRFPPCEIETKHQLCFRHWHLISRDLRKSIWAATNSIEKEQAIQNAIRVIGYKQRMRGELSDDITGDGHWRGEEEAWSKLD